MSLVLAPALRLDADGPRQLLVALKDGDGQQELDLAMTDTQAGERVALIASEVDNDLKHLFFKWRDSFGAVDQHRDRWNTGALPARVMPVC